MKEKEFLDILLFVWTSFSINIRIGEISIKTAGQNECLRLIRKILLDFKLIDQNGQVKENHGIYQNC